LGKLRDVTFIVIIFFNNRGNPKTKLDTLLVGAIILDPITVFEMDIFKGICPFKGGKVYQKNGVGCNL
jgi:hypothetical protein